MNNPYTTRQARDSLKGVLDAADNAATPLVVRDGVNYAVLDENRLRTYLKHANPIEPRIGLEDGIYLAYIPGQPFIGEGATIDEAVTMLANDIRDYAAAWATDHEQLPQHATNYGLVQLVNMLNDSELVEWMWTR